MRKLAYAVAIASAGSLAAQAAAEPANPAIVEEVIVTGSYIAGSPGDAPSPVQTLAREEIVTSGVSDIGELIRNLEIASGSDTAPQNEFRFNGNSGSGLANVNLRGVGPTATLVLMDGKRLPFAGQKLADGDRFVDVNSIPITMIERVEVLKDGGSAIYGSDAIAGVVNFITRSDFEGLEFTAKYLETDQGGQNDVTYGGIFGWQSDDDRSSFVIGGEYFDRGLLFSSERRDLTQNVFPRQNPTIVNRFTFNGPDVQCEAQGFFVNDGFGGDPNGCFRPGADTEIFIPEQERASILATASHMFNEHLEVYAQGSYLDSRSGQSAPVYVGPIEPKYALPGILNALVPAGIGSDPANDPSLAVNGGSTFPPLLSLELLDYSVRNPGIDADRNYDSHNEQTTTRYQIGARGDFEFRDRPWNYDVSYTRGDSEFATNFLGLDSDRLELAHYGLGGPNCTPDGNLADPTARFLLAGADGVFNSASGVPGAVGPLESTFEALMGTVPGQPFINPDNVVVAMTSTNRGDNSQGCFFFNPYLTRNGAPGFTNSEELLRWLEVEMQESQRSETFINVFDAVAAGELFDLGDRAVSMAIGLQYREEGRETVVNPQITGEVNSFGQLSGRESVGGLSENRNFDDDRDVWAAFVEFQVPLGEDVDVQLAARYEDYGDDIGDTFDPKVGIRWQTTESFVLRGSASSSFRGPGLAQIAEGNGFSLEFGVADVLGEGTNPAGQNCVKTGRCPVPDTLNAPSIIIVKEGQPTPDLQPETAVTFNVGGIWTPLDGPLQGLEVGLDYYSIAIEDKIIDVPTQSLLAEELALFNAALGANDFVVSVPGQPDFGQACDPTAGEFDPGQPRGEFCQVNPAAYALTPAVSGFPGGRITRRPDASRDLQIIASGALNTGKVETDGLDAHFIYQFDNSLGFWVVDGRMNYIREFMVSDFPGGQPDFDAAGFTNNDPTRRLVRSMPDMRGNLGLSYARGNHTARLNMRWIGEYEDNATPNNRIGDGKIDAYQAFDFNYNYTFDLRGADVVLTLGAIDLFDENLPKLKNANGTDLTVFDPRGRRLYGSVKVAL